MMLISMIVFPLILFFPIVIGTAILKSRKPEEKMFNFKRVFGMVVIVIGTVIVAMFAFFAITVATHSK